MAAKKLVFDQEARNKIASGLNAIANVVKVTLGPRGRNVALEKPWGAPLVTKDGVTVAKEIELEDRFAGLGVQMVKLVAATTATTRGLVPGVDVSVTLPSSGQRSGTEPTM